MSNLRFPRRDRSEPHSSNPEAQAEGAIGSVKKLPSKSPSPHIAKTPDPIGSVNAKGQKKFLDPTTGKIAMIDMKSPRVKGPRGLPVKG